jgi:glutaredoxin
MKSLIPAAMAALLVATIVPSSAEMYRYTDGKGQLCFVDDISKVPKKYRKQIRSADDLPEVNVMQAPPASTKRGSAAVAGQQKGSARRFDGTVELYSTEWCPHCKRAEAYMLQKGIRFAKHDIEKDSAAKRRYEELGAGGVPLILVGSEKMNGFTPEALEYRLNR